MTPLQLDTYIWIKVFIKAHGYSPSYREIAEGIDRHVGDVHRIVGVLISKGYLRKTAPYSARSLEVVR